MSNYDTRSEALAHAVNLARDWIHKTGADVEPERIVEDAETYAAFLSGEATPSDVKVNAVVDRILSDAAAGAMTNAIRRLMADSGQDKRG